MKTGIGTTAILGIALLACLGARGDTLVLHEDAYVKGPSVRLGDIASIEGENAEELATLELTAAASPGAGKNISASLVEMRLRDAGVEVQDWSIEGPRSVRATTMALELTPEILAESLRRHILMEMPWDNLDTEVDVPLPLSGMTVPDGELHIEWRANPQYRYIGSGAFRGTISVDGAVKKTLLCKAEVEPYTEIVVAALDIPRGKPVSQGDLELRKMSLSRAPSGVVLEPSQVVGQLARKTLFAGAPLSARDVEPRTVIQRNQIVVVEMMAGGLRVQTRARAMSMARAGDMVLCANLNSKDQFQGVARADGVVEVQ